MEKYFVRLVYRGVGIFREDYTSVTDQMDMLLLCGTASAAGMQCAASPRTSQNAWSLVQKGRLAIIEARYPLEATPA